MLAACAIVVLGLAASITASLLWRASVRAREKQTFQTSAANVSGTLKTLLRRDTDFVTLGAAVLTLQPNLSASGFDQWLALLEDHQGQPAGYGALIVKSVPAAQLARVSGAAQCRSGVSRARGQVRSNRSPPTGRPRYCLLSGGTADLLLRPGNRRLLEGDWCDPDLADRRIPAQRHHASTVHAGDHRRRSVRGLLDNARPTSTSLIIEVAAYRQGVPLRSVAQRRAPCSAGCWARSTSRR